MNHWHVHRVDAEPFLVAAEKLGSVPVGHLMIDTHASMPHWWWRCCCGIAGGFTGMWEHTSFVLAGFMTRHRFCARLAAWDREETRPIAYQIEPLPSEETPARGRR